MPTAMPLTEFEISTDAVVLSDAGGTIRLMNGPASALLQCRPDDVVGKPCWEVMKLKSPNGTAMCSRLCHVQKSFLADHTCVRQTALSVLPDGTRRTLELLSLKIPPASNGRFGVLHMILPKSSKQGRARSPQQPRLRPDRLERLKTLTPRESQILDALAHGESTAALAARLCLSSATVRNHIRNILGKLKVHSRLDAVLIWISRGS